MFSSPMSHYFRHALLAYRERGKSLGKKLQLLRQLNAIEAECAGMQRQSLGHPKLAYLLEKARLLKGKL